MTWSFPCRWQMVGPGLARGRVNGMIRSGTSRMVVINVTQHAVKQMPCRGCGEPMTVGIRTRIQPRCIMCGIQESIIATRQLRERSGPYYDKWCESMARVGERYSRGTGGGSGSPRGSAEN